MHVELTSILKVYLAPPIANVSLCGDAAWEPQLIMAAGMAPTKLHLDEQHITLSNFLK
jgi:hypothetical protein